MLFIGAHQSDEMAMSTQKASVARRQRNFPVAAPIVGLGELVRDPETLVGSADVVRLRLAPSYKTLLRLVGEGKFPPPLQLGNHYLTWRARILLTWLDRREEESLAAPERAGQARKRRIDLRRR
jgi:predicted DNA-binding transcriptional regulator AlpA